MVVVELEVRMSAPGGSYLNLILELTDQPRGTAGTTHGFISLTLNVSLPPSLLSPCADTEESGDGPRGSGGCWASPYESGVGE